MNVYDEANNLAHSLKNSEEYITFKTARQFINTNPELKQKIDNFEKARYESQMNILQKGNNEQEELKKVQEIYEEIIQIEEIKKYFDAELRFNVLLADVNKIITEAVKDVIMN